MARKSRMFCLESTTLTAVEPVWLKQDHVLSIHSTVPGMRRVELSSDAILVNDDHQHKAGGIRWRLKSAEVAATGSVGRTRGPQPTPSSALLYPRSTVRAAECGSRGTRADEGVRPTKV